MLLELLWRLEVVWRLEVWRLEELWRLQVLWRLEVLVGKGLCGVVARELDRSVLH